MTVRLDSLDMAERQDLDDDWLTVSEAAALTDPPISVSTLIRWENDGKLAAVKTLGGHRRFRRSDIESLMKQQAS